MSKMALGWMQIIILGGLYLSSLGLKRQKRVIGGFGPLPDHDRYNTHYAVALFNTWGCLSHQFNHNLRDCVNFQGCTGSLIKPDFVLTACHCMVYEDHYFRDYKERLPPIDKNRAIPYIVDKLEQMDLGYVDVPGELSYRRRTIRKHPLLNGMTIMAGSTVKYGTQRRHASKFFPHHLCGERTARYHKSAYTEYVDGRITAYFYEMDIGLLQSCYPFELNKEVGLAPIKPYISIDDHLRKVLREYQTCLAIGWGLILDPLTPKQDPRNLKLVPPLVMHHDFRYIQCFSSCSIPHTNCIICDYSHGPNITSLGKGDSGGPLVCDGFVTGVTSRASRGHNWFLVYNDTANLHTAVACVKEFITERHIDYLRSTNEEIFHFQDGRPVTYGPKRKGSW